MSRVSIDPARLRRAIHLEAQRAPSGGWIVGDWAVHPERGCTCPDRTLRGATCKHELRARLEPLDAEMIHALRDVTGDAE